MSFEIQQKIKQNALEMREYVSDLYGWEQEMELKEKAKAKLIKEEEKKKQEEAKTTQPEVRQSKVQKEEPKPVEKKKDLVRDVNTVGEYYKAWDQFDVDKELTKLEEEEQKAYKPYNPYEDSRTNMRAKPKTKINVSGRRVVVSDPTDLKDKGNLHFQSLEYDKAINCYSECLSKLEAENIAIEDMTADQKKLRCIVLSNRSMAYLKIQETAKALHDANLSLTYNQQYSKSYYRRAECLKKLGKYRESLRDFKMVRLLQPAENKAEAEIKKIEAFLAKRSKEAREAMIVEYHPDMLVGSRRIDIEEQEELTQEEVKAEKTNYLEEL